MMRCYLGALSFAALLCTPAMAQQVPDPMSRSASSIYYARQTGNCTWSTTGDAGPCINQAIEAAGVAGGGTVILPVGTFGVSTPISTGRDHIELQCAAPSGSLAASAPYTTPAGPEVGGCELKWTGAAGGKILSLVAPNDQKSLVGAKLDNIKFHGNNGLAGTALYLSGVHGGVYNNLKFVGGFNNGVVIDLDVSRGDHLIGVGGTQWNNFTDTHIYNWGYSSHGVKLGFYQSATPGSIGVNASLNTFNNLHIFTGSGAATKGIWCWGCDNNKFNMAYVSTGTGSVSIDLDIYTDNGQWFPATGNIFDHVAYGVPSGGTAVARGQTTYPTCIGFRLSPNFGNCTWGNEFRHVDGSNGVPPPIAEPGAYVKYSLDYGVSVNAGGAFMAGDGTRPAQTIMRQYSDLHGCGADATSYAAGLATHYCFINQPILLFSNARTIAAERDHFTLGLIGGTPGAADLRWTRPFGTGRYVFGDANVQADGALIVGGAGPTCNTAQGSLCLVNGAQTGVQLTDGIGHWFIRQNASQQMEIFQGSNSVAMRMDDANFPQVWFTGPITPANSVVANLPTCNATTKYSIAAVSDQNGAPTYRGPLTGGGSLAALAFCTGAAWVAH